MAGGNGSTLLRNASIASVPDGWTLAGKFIATEESELLNPNTSPQDATQTGNASLLTTHRSVFVDSRSSPQGPQGGASSPDTEAGEEPSLAISVTIAPDAQKAQQRQSVSNRSLASATAIPDFSAASVGDHGGHGGERWSLSEPRGVDTSMASLASIIPQSPSRRFSKRPSRNVSIKEPSSLVDDAHSMADRVDTLERQLDVVNASKAQVEADQRSLEEKLAQKEQEVTQLRAGGVREVREARLAEVRSAAQSQQQVATLEASIARLEQSKQNADGMKEQLMRSMKERKREVDIARNETKAFSQKHAMALQELNATTEELNEHRTQLERECATVAALKGRKLDLEFQNTTLVSEVADMQSQLAVAQRGKEDAERASERAKEKLKRVEGVQGDLIEERDQLQLEVTSLMQKTKAADARLKSLYSEKDALLAEVSALRKTATVGADEAHAETRAKRALEDKVTLLQRECDQMTKLRDEAVQTREDIRFAFEAYRREQEAAMDTTNAQRQAMRDENQTLTLEVHRLRDTLGRLENEAHRAMEERISRDRHNHTLQRDLEASKKDAAMKDERLGELGQKYATLEAVHSELALSTDKTVKEHLNRILDLENVSSTAAIRALELEKEVETLQKTVAQVEADLAAARSAKATLQQRMTEEGVAHVTRETELRATGHRLQIDLDSANGSLEMARAESSRAQNLAESLREEAEALYADINTMKADVAEQKNTTGLLRAEKVRLGEEVESLTVRLSCAEDEGDRLAEQLRQADAGRSQARSELGSLQRDAETAQLAAAAADRRLAVARSESDRLLQELRKLKREREDMTAQQDELRSRNNALTREVEAVKESLVDAKAKVAAQQSELGEVGLHAQEAKEEARAKIATVETLERALAALRDKMTALEVQGESAGARAAKAADQAAERHLQLESEVAAAQGEVARVTGEAQTLLQQVEAARTVEIELRTALSAAKEQAVQGSTDAAHQRMEQERATLLLREDLADREAAVERLRTSAAAQKRAEDALRAERDEAMAHSTALAYEKDALSVALKRSEDQAAGLAAELLSVSTTHRQIKLEHETGVERCERLERDVARLKQERTALRTKHAAAVEEGHVLRANLGRLDGSTSYSRLHKEAEDLRAALDASEKARLALEHQHEIVPPVAPALPEMASVRARSPIRASTKAVHAAVSPVRAAVSCRVSHLSSAKASMPPTPKIPTPLAALPAPGPLSETAESIVRSILGK